MIGGGLSYSTVTSASGAGRVDSEPSGPPDSPHRALEMQAPPVADSFAKPFTATPEDSMTGPASHVPFLPIGEDVPRKLKGSVTQQFFQWYNKQPMLVQWLILSPMLILLVLLLQWDPNGVSDAPNADAPKAEEKSRHEQKSDSAEKSRDEAISDGNDAEVGQAPTANNAGDADPSADNI